MQKIYISLFFLLCVSEQQGKAASLDAQCSLKGDLTLTLQEIKDTYDCSKTQENLPLNMPYVLGCASSMISMISIISGISTVYVLRWLFKKTRTEQKQTQTEIITLGKGEGESDSMFEEEDYHILNDKKMDLSLRKKFFNDLKESVMQKTKKRSQSEDGSNEGFF